MRPSDRPLAWAQLSHQKVRLMVAMSGIAFANVLIFMQLGFLSMFNEGATTLPENLQGDLFLLDQEAQSINMGPTGFDRIRLYQAGAIAGVQSVTPLYIRSASWAYSKNQFSYGTRVMAYDPRQPVLAIAEVKAQRDKLAIPLSFLFDRTSRDSHGPIAQILATAPMATAFMNNRRVAAVGLFTLGSSMVAGGEGNVITSDATYAEIFGSDALQKVTIGVLQIQSGANLQAIQRGIQQTVPGVQVFTRAELISKELQVQKDNPTGIIFGFGATMGFVVGIVIVYQVLYADVSDHLAEYATLKAMGYSDRSLLFVIFHESTLLAVLGFAPGLIISFGMYQLLSIMTKLPLLLSPYIAIFVFILTLVMCTCSALLASGKLRSADPSDIF
jgi:putative ABC transport system permease protein